MVNRPSSLIPIASPLTRTESRHYVTAKSLSAGGTIGLTFMRQRSDSRRTEAEEEGISVRQRIPFNRANLTGNEFRYIFKALENGYISGDGRFTKTCHEFLERELSVPKSLLTTSCTDALEMAALLLD